MRHLNQAFCGISTGIYGYPLYEASHIALKTVRRWLEEGDNRTKFDSIIFCVFLDKVRCWCCAEARAFPPGVDSLGRVVRVVCRSICATNS